MIKGNFFIKGIAPILFFLCSHVRAQEVSSLKDSLRIDGGVNLRNVLYNVSGIDDRRVPFSYVVGANINISKGEFSVPFSITYSEQERSFSQPFSQYGLTPSYKWVKTYIGYNSINWNTYTMGGAQFTGAGVELTPKKMRFGLMYGRFRRATPADSIGFINENGSIPSFERRGWSAKIGYGTDSRFVDLTLFKGQDRIDGNSPLLKDSITQIFPAENTAVGLKVLTPITKSISFHAEGGASLFNRDKTAPELSTSEIESPLLNILSALHTTRISTSLFYGGNAGLNINTKGHTFGLTTKYVLPDYQAMGIYYMDNDVFSYGFTHAFAIWKSKLSLNYGLNKLNDNLLDRKPATTIRLQPLVSASFNPSSIWGIELNWNNYYTRQEDGTISLSDSFKIDQSNPNLSITPHAQWGDTLVYHTVFLSYTNTQLTDNNSLTREFSQYIATVYGLNYSRNLLQKNMGVSAGANYTQNQSNGLDEKAYGLNLGLNKSHKENIWNLGANLGVQFSNLSNALSFGLNGTRILRKKQNLNLGLTFLNNNSKQATVSSFNELTVTLTYTKNFNYVHKAKH